MNKKLRMNSSFESLADEQLRYVVLVYLKFLADMEHRRQTSKNSPAGLENFRSLLEGNVDDLNVKSLFIEFTWLVAKSGALFHFEIGESWYDDEEGLQLSMTATHEDGRYLLLTTDNHGEVCIDARRQHLDQDGEWTGSILDMVAKSPRFAELTEKVPHLVQDFLDEDYGRQYDDWYMEN